MDTAWDERNRTGTIRPKSSVGQTSPDAANGVISALVENEDEAESPNEYESASNATEFYRRIGRNRDEPDSPELCGSGGSPCQSPEPLDDSEESDESMANNVETASQPRSYRESESPRARTAAKFSRLTIDQQNKASKRPRSPGIQPTNHMRWTAVKRGRGISGKPSPSLGRNADRDGRGSRNYGRSRKPLRSTLNKSSTGRFFYPIAQDSGYGSRENTFRQTSGGPDLVIPGTSGSPALPTLPKQPRDQLMECSENGCLQSSTVPRDPALILQPESSPISTDQLAAEVKGIYAGLVMVEAKCISIDAAQSNDPNLQLGLDQWQALIALHRTLLYEHHDFLMATQHPSATPALRALPSKYSMPARMWRHGIHAFLEVLRHRRPESQDYMMHFIYLAYQMMALLFETVPSFTDTWIECLGDLARYRMAIEEEREAHYIWGGVAARWYNTASDRHPATGRLYHHLGILERPSLKKLFLYAKSLTCAVPFSNAKDSLHTLCAPIAEEHLRAQSDDQSAESLIVTYHAVVTSDSGNLAIFKTGSDAIERLSRLNTSKIRDIGVELVVTNVAALFEFGSPDNYFVQLFGKAVSDSVLASRPSMAAAPSSTASGSWAQEDPTTFASTTKISSVFEFSYSAFNIFIREQKDRQAIRNILPSVHTMLVWIHAVFSVRSWAATDPGFNAFGSFADSHTFSWGGLCDLLNAISQIEPISARTIELARQGLFPARERNKDAKILAEDYSIRGLIWAHFYFPADWFDQENDAEGRAIETPKTHKARIERIQWLGAFLAFRIETLQFDEQTRSFSAPFPISPQLTQPAQLTTTAVHSEENAVQLISSSRSPTTLSAHSDSDGYMVIDPRHAPQIKSSPVTMTRTSRPTKTRLGSSDVKIFDEESMLLDP